MPSLLNQPPTEMEGQSFVLLTFFIPRETRGGKSLYPTCYPGNACNLCSTNLQQKCRASCCSTDIFTPREARRGKSLYPTCYPGNFCMHAISAQPTSNRNGGPALAPLTFLSHARHMAAKSLHPTCYPGQNLDRGKSYNIRSIYFL